MHIANKESINGDTNKTPTDMASYVSICVLVDKQLTLRICQKTKKTQTAKVSKRAAHKANILLRVQANAQ